MSERSFKIFDEDPEKEQVGRRGFLFATGLGAALKAGKEIISEHRKNNRPWRKMYESYQQQYGISADLLEQTFKDLAKRSIESVIITEKDLEIRCWIDSQGHHRIEVNNKLRFPKQKKPLDHGNIA